MLARFFFQLPTLIARPDEKMSGLGAMVLSRTQPPLTHLIPRLGLEPLPCRLVFEATWLRYRPHAVMRDISRPVGSRVSESRVCLEFTSRTWAQAGRARPSHALTDRPLNGQSGRVCWTNVSP
jgi:hypothetical protein